MAGGVLLAFWPDDDVVEVGRRADGGGASSSESLNVRSTYNDKQTRI